MHLPLMVDELAGWPRSEEPVTVGVPLPIGAAHHLDRWTLLDEQGHQLPLQWTALARWPDGSLKWVLVDTLISAPANGSRVLRLDRDRPLPDPGTQQLAPGLTVEHQQEGLCAHTGLLTAAVSHRASDRFARLGAGENGSAESGIGLRLTLSDADRVLFDVSPTSVTAACRGPVRTTFTIRGRLGPVLQVVLRLSVWAGSELVRLDVTVRNPQRAQHAGGLWDLGDPGSYLFSDLSLHAVVPPDATQPRLRWTDEAAGQLVEQQTGQVEIYQDSSGGERWCATTHVNRYNKMPLTFRGYQVRTSDGLARTGNRASPSVWHLSEKARVGATVREFWQNFPKAVAATSDGLRIRLWPAPSRELHELQGGEQKTHSVWLSLGPPTNLGWVQRPLLAHCSPEHYVRSGAFPHLVEWDQDRNRELCDLVKVAIDPEQGLAQRRELIDQFGWRHFGDTYADHENAGNPGPALRVSHYNNQYDHCYAALAQFVRSGDPRWFQLGDEIARHVADIDIYHTREDRPAYNGGLFWHTDHHTDAATSTHRCYSARAPQAQRGPYGGGPSAEHDYATGLATHFFMTGWPPSREGALSLAEWVIGMDGEPLPLLGHLLPGPSGLASRTVDGWYHGPGRGAGNSLATLLDAYELTNNEWFLDRAERILRRCIHPHDRPDDHELVTDPEHRWSYTVFLLSVQRYLETKVVRGEVDEAYAFGQAALLTYARWMLQHEGLTSRRKELLLLWTESWPAQDLRKGLILLHAARHTPDPHEQRLFWQRGEALLAEAQSELMQFETRTLTRPLALVMRYGYTGSALLQASEITLWPQGVLKNPGPPSRFVPWKEKPRALARRARRFVDRVVRHAG